jgi:hypothetical protein
MSGFREAGAEQRGIFAVLLSTANGTLLPRRCDAVKASSAGG